ncbi:MAG TPA: hypothetical protein VK747_03255, partial [Blastocatellia bacterium]|nr:hypothetical protein [Blastocatellia bacterium]
YFLSSLCVVAIPLRLCEKQVLAIGFTQSRKEPQRLSDDPVLFTYNMPKPVWEERTGWWYSTGLRYGPKLATRPANAAFVNDKQLRNRYLEARKIE